MAEEHVKAVDLSGGNVMTKSALGRAYALAGCREEAEAVREELAPLSPYRAATIDVALGDLDVTFQSLEQGLAARDYWMVWLKVDAMFESLRGDRRFGRLIGQVGFPGAKAAAPASPKLSRTRRRRATRVRASRQENQQRAGAAAGARPKKRR